MYFAASKRNLAVRVMARMESLDSPERFPAVVSLEERSSLRASRIGKCFEVESQPLETPDPILRDG